jgi:hypothetical protein
LVVEKFMNRAAGVGNMMMGSIEQPGVRGCRAEEGGGGITSFAARFCVPAA